MKCWWQSLPEYRQILVNFFATSRELISAYLRPATRKLLYGE